MPADAKPVSASRLVLAQEMTPQDANPAGNVHGGNIMKLAENPRTGKKTHTNFSYILMVALDDDGRPVEVPRLILETEEDRRRMDQLTVLVEDTQGFQIFEAIERAKRVLSSAEDADIVVSHPGTEVREPTRAARTVSVVEGLAREAQALERG